jgi:hypothetical protein
MCAVIGAPQFLLFPRNSIVEPDFYCLGIKNLMATTVDSHLKSAPKNLQGPNLVIGERPLMRRGCEPGEPPSTLGVLIMTTQPAPL